MLAYARRLNRRHIALGLGVLLLAAGAWTGWHAIADRAGLSTPAPVAQPLDPAPAPSVLIFVSGGVVHPGLYRLSPDARVADALAAAGGLTIQADLGRLPNLASRVHDGKQVNIPVLRSGRGSAGASVAKLDVNSARVDELATVPGMPAGLPEAIIEYRTRVGAFTSLAELKDTLGVDRSLMTMLSRFLTVAVP